MTSFNMLSGLWYMVELTVMLGERVFVGETIWSVVRRVREITGYLDG